MGTQGRVRSEESWYLLLSTSKAQCWIWPITHWGEHGNLQRPLLTVVRVFPVSRVYRTLRERSKEKECSHRDTVARLQGGRSKQKEIWERGPHMGRL